MKYSIIVMTIIQMPSITKKIANGRRNPKKEYPIKPRAIARNPITIAIPIIICARETIKIHLKWF